MQWHRLVTAAAFAMMAAAPAQAGFWGDLKEGIGTAADNIKRDGAKAADAVGDAAGDAADYVTGDSEPAATGAVETSPEPVAKGTTPQPTE
jgi:hypothetical protein